VGWTCSYLGSSHLYLAAQEEYWVYGKKRTENLTPLR
jgi:hypothetical protein